MRLKLTSISCALIALMFAVSGIAQTSQLPTEVSAGTGQGTIVVLTSNAPVYLLPDINRQPLLVAKSGSSVRLLNTDGEWANIQFLDGQLGRRVGYVQAKTVAGATPSTAAAAPPPSPRTVAPTKPSATVSNAPTPPSPPTAAPTATGSIAATSPVSPPALATSVTPDALPASAYKQVKASSATLNITKGSSVVVAIPTAVLERDGVRLAGGVIYAATIRRTSDGVAVGDNELWQTAGFPSMLEGHVEKVTRRNDYTELEIRGGRMASYGAIKLRFTPAGTDIMPATQYVMIQGNARSSEATAYVQEAYRLLARRFFTGQLASIPEAKQLELVQFAHVTAMAQSLTTAEFKDNSYVGVNVGFYPAVLNEIRLSQGPRIGYVLNDRYLKVLKSFAVFVHDVPQVYGLKLSFMIEHKNFLNESSFGVDKVDIYAPATLIKQFAEAEITNEKFIDGCVVIANDNRVEVDLTAASQ
jgi:hypothetical protein